MPMQNDRKVSPSDRSDGRQASNGQFEKGSERAREAGRKGGQSSH